MEARLLILFMLLANMLTAQSVAIGYPGRLFVDFGNGYSVAEESFDHHITRLTIRNKATRKVKAEYIRWNDSAFLYNGYDSLGKLLESGILALNQSQKANVEVPFVDTMYDCVTVYRDISFRGFQYSKQGHWQEYRSPGVKWQGMYKDGMKDGMWLKSKDWYTDDFYENIDSIRLYENGLQKTNDYSQLSPEKVFELLKGKWKIDFYKNGYDYHVYHRNSETCNELFDLDFVSGTKLIEKLEWNNYSRVYSWKVSGNNLELDNNAVYKILLLAQDQLILQRIKDE